MIVLRVCGCGRALDAIAWASLPSVRRDVHDGSEWQTRRCTCGIDHEVMMHEDDSATAIVEALADSRSFYRHAVVDIAIARISRASRLPLRLEQFKAHRAAARDARARAALLETTLASLYRARELISPRLRVGRNLAVIGEPSSAEAKPAVGRR
jgi:hypothetical protein